MEDDELPPTQPQKETKPAVQTTTQPVQAQNVQAQTIKAQQPSQPPPQPKVKE